MDKSLVLAEENEGATRYRMLDTLKQYGAEKLESSGQAEQVKYRRLRRFAALAEEAESKLREPDSAAWLNRLKIEHGNLRAALSWRDKRYGNNKSDSEWLVLRFAGSLLRFWDVRGYLAEGREPLARALELTSEWKGNQNHRDQEARAKTLYGAGILAMSQADFVASRKLLHESLSVFRTSRDNRGIANALNGLGNVASNQADYIAALPFYKESLTLRRALGDKQGVVSSLNNLGLVALRQGDLPGARALFEECIILNSEIGDKSGKAASLFNLSSVVSEQGDSATARLLLEEVLAFYREMNDKNGIANALNDLGFVLCGQKNPAAAEPLFEESLVIYAELGNQIGVATALEGLAWSLLNTEDSQTYIAVIAVAVWAACSALRKRMGVPLPPNGQPKYNERLEKARLTLCETAYAATWAEGSVLSIEQAIEVVRRRQHENSNGASLTEQVKFRPRNEVYLER